MTECVYCHATSFYYTNDTLSVANARERVIFYEKTHSFKTHQIPVFLMDCCKCKKQVCSNCLYIDNWSLEIAICPACRRCEMLAFGMTKTTRAYFTRDARQCIWTMLLLRQRWKKEGHLLAVLPNLFWLQNFAKCLV